MKTKFIKSGNMYSPIAIDKGVLSDSLEPAIYDLKVGKKGPFLIRTMERYVLPNEIHGNRLGTNIKYTKLSYDKTDKPLGLLISGTKGSGKTILAKSLCNMFMDDYRLPIINVNEYIEPDIITMVIRSVGPCVVFFDEYGKTYNNKKDSLHATRAADDLLGYFEDASLGKVVNILTENNPMDVGPFVLERPSRIKHHFNYDGPTPDEIKSILDSFSKLDKGIKDIINLWSTIFKLNLDSIQLLASEGMSFKTVDDFVNYTQTLNVSDLVATNYKIETTIRHIDGSRRIPTNGDKIEGKLDSNFNIIITRNNIEVYNKPLIDAGRSGMVLLEDDVCILFKVYSTSGKNTYNDEYNNMNRTVKKSKSVDLDDYNYAPF